MLHSALGRVGDNVAWLVRRRLAGARTQMVDVRGTSAKHEQDGAHVTDRL